MQKKFANWLFLFGATGLALYASTIGLDALCTQKIVKNTTGTACEVERSLGVFTANDKFENCISTSAAEFGMFDEIALSYPVQVQYCFIAFTIGSMVVGLISVIVALYNIFSRPYQTFADTSAFIIYHWMAIVFGANALIFYIVLWTNLYPNSLPESADGGNFPSEDKGYTVESTSAQTSFYLFCGGYVCFVFGLVVSYLAKRDSEKIKEEEDFIEGPKGVDNGAVFSL